MLTLSRYHLERSRCDDAEIKIESALGVCELGRASSSLHHASIHRVYAAIAFESGRLDEATEFVNEQLQQLELHNTAQGNALKRSGLLDRTPDALTFSSNLPPGIFVVLPFRSICNFGFRLYLMADDEKALQYPTYLQHAEICFSTALKDCKNAQTKTIRRDLR